VLITVGNFAAAFARETLGLSLDAQVKCSNFIGNAFAAAIELGFERALLVGHSGKLVKLGLGILNTHSSLGDGRMEALIACALSAGADVVLLRGIADCVSTDAALSLLREAGLLEAAMERLGLRIDDTLRRHCAGHLESGFICFGKREEALSKQGEIVCQSANAQALMEVFR
jgi:cobalt-precorrin-5B (C1)-methyltransferase